MTGQRKHQKVKFRPHFADFVSETRQFADLFIFSSMDILRLNNLWKKYFSEDFSGCFNKSLLMRYKKNIAPLLTISSDVLLIDDSPEHVHPRSLQHYLPVNRWLGDEKDCELLRILSEIRRLWNLEGIYTTKIPD